MHSRWSAKLEPLNTNSLEAGTPPATKEPMNEILLLNLGTDEPYDLDKLSSSGVTVAAYRYESRDYDGSGDMIYRDATGLWHHHSLGHCSCYGPIEDLSFASAGFETLDGLLGNCSAELRGELEPLAAALRDLGLR